MNATHESIEASLTRALESTGAKVAEPISDRRTRIVDERNAEVVEPTEHHHHTVGATVALETNHGAIPARITALRRLGYELVTILPSGGDGYTVATTFATVHAWTDAARDEYLLWLGTCTREAQRRAHDAEHTYSIAKERWSH